jgi:hypothetical protein
MLSIFKTLLQLVLATGIPHTTCMPVHHDTGIGGTYYLYCSRITPDGTELISVGLFVPNLPQ